MNFRRSILVALALTAAPLRFAAAEDKVELKASSTMREVLASCTGKRVALRIDEGQELDGTVTLVGDQVVQLSRLVGRDYSDAYVRLDSIKAVIVKAR